MCVLTVGQVQALRACVVNRAPFGFIGKALWQQQQPPPTEPGRGAAMQDHNNHPASALTAAPPGFYETAENQEMEYNVTTKRGAPRSGGNNLPLSFPPPQQSRPWSPPFPVKPATDTPATANTCPVREVLGANQNVSNHGEGMEAALAQARWRGSQEDLEHPSGRSKSQQGSSVAATPSTSVNYIASRSNSGLPSAYNSPMGLSTAAVQRHQRPLRPTSSGVVVLEEAASSRPPNVEDAPLVQQRSGSLPSQQMDMPTCPVQEDGRAAQHHSHSGAHMVAQERQSSDIPNQDLNGSGKMAKDSVECYLVKSMRPLADPVPIPPLDRWLDMRTTPTDRSVPKTCLPRRLRTAIMHKTS